MSTTLFTVPRGRIRDEQGFTLIEVVMAMGIILLSLAVLAATAIVGFTGVATARQRQTATAIADQVVEQVRGLPFSTVSEGLKDSDLTDPGKISGGACTLTPCAGESIVHSSGASTAPLYPHTATIGPPTYPDTFTRGVYLTYAGGNTSLYRLTVQVSWTSGARTSSVQTQTLLSKAKGSGDSTTSTSSGGSAASFYATGSATPGNVILTPNASVYSGIGVSGLSSSVWNLGDSVTQTMYGLDDELAQGQVTKVNGQSTMTAAKKSISGTVTSSPTTPLSTYSTADDDTTTSTIGTSSAPTSISQTGPSLSLTGSGNSLTLNQYTQTTTTTTTTGTVTKRSASSATSATGSITITAPSGLTVVDFMLAGFSYQGTCMSTPSGWTLVRCDTKDTSGSAPRVSSSVFYRFATASDVSAGSFSFTTGGTTATVGGVVAYTGADPTNPIDTSGAATGSSTTATTPTMSVTSNARLVSFFAARGNTTVTPSDPGTAASNWGQNWSATAGSLPPTRNYLTGAPALSTTAGSGTLSSGNTQSSTFVLAKSFARTVNTDYASGAGNWSFQVSVSALAGPYEYYFRLVRQNSAGVQQSASGNSTTWTDTGTKTYTFNWNPGTWQSGDKLVVEWYHRRPSGTGNKSATIDTTSASYVDAPATADDFYVGGAAAGGNKRPAGQGVLASGWSASLSQSALWVAQLVSLTPSNVTTSTTTTGSPGTESGSTVSTTAATVSPPCGSPAQTDSKACAYGAQSYSVPSGVDNAFLSTTVDFTNSTNGYSGLGACRLYRFSPPNSSSTNYAYGRRAATTGDGKVREDVTRYYGTHMFGGMCAGTGSTPSSWPGYFVKYDASTSASQAVAEAGVSTSSPTASAAAGTISVWNGAGVTSFAVPASGIWSTAPTSVDFTTDSNYRYQISSTLGSNLTSATSTGSGTVTDAKAVVGSPVIGTISYKLTDQTNSRVLIDVTLTIDLGSLVSTAKYTAAA